MQRFDLKDSPFYLLDVSPRSDRGSLAAAVDKALDSGELDETTVNRAQQLLMATKPRLAAEVAWLLGVAPARIRLLVESADVPSGALAELPPLAGTNLAAHKCSADAPAWADLEFLVKEQEALDATEVAASVNAERRVSGFGQVDLRLVEESLTVLRGRHLEAAAYALATMPSGGNGCVKLIAQHRQAGQRVSAFIDDLVERFDVHANPKLQKLQDGLFTLLGSISDHGSISEAEHEAIRNGLSHWQDLAGPNQLIAAGRSMVDPRTKAVFERIRATVLYLNNEKNEPAQAFSLVNTVTDFFAHVPEVGDRLTADLAKLTELVEERKFESVFRPLTSILESAAKNHADLSSSTLRGQFRSGGTGLAGTLYRAFDCATLGCAGTAYADRPFVAVRSLAIDLNNDSSSPEAALLLVRALQSHDAAAGAPEVLERLAQDERTLQRLSLQKELNAAAQKKALSRILSIISSLEPITDDPDERKTLADLRGQVRKQRRSKYIQWGVYGGIALLIFIGKLFDQPSSPARPQPSAGIPSQNTSDLSAATVLELLPPVSTGRVLSRAELRYCKFEIERLKAVRKIVGEQPADGIVDRYNASLTDWNSRCSNNKFTDDDGPPIDAEIAAGRDRIESDGRQRIAQWTANGIK
jgi:hypothetical protein